MGLIIRSESLIKSLFVTSWGLWFYLRKAVIWKAIVDSLLRIIWVYNCLAWCPWMRIFCDLSRETMLNISLYCLAFSHHSRAVCRVSITLVGNHLCWKPDVAICSIFREGCISCWFLRPFLCCIRGRAPVFNNDAVWLRFERNLGAAVQLLSIAIYDDILVVRVRVNRLGACPAIVVGGRGGWRLILFDYSDALTTWINWLELPEIPV